MRVSLPSPLYLPYISRISPVYLPYISRIPPVYLPQIESATRVTLPAGLPMGAKGLLAQGGAIPWMKTLAGGAAHLLLYTREEYQALSRPLGIWLESPRGT